MDSPWPQCHVKASSKSIGGKIYFLKTVREPFRKFATAFRLTEFLLLQPRGGWQYGVNGHHAAAIQADRSASQPQTARGDGDPRISVARECESESNYSWRGSIAARHGLRHHSSRKTASANAHARHDFLSGKLGTLALSRQNFPDTQGRFER